MIPLKDDNPTRRTPFVTLALIALNVAIFVWQILLPPEEGRRVVEVFGAIPADLAGASRGSVPPGTPPALTLLTSMFLHGSILHVGGNMLYLWIFGNNIEDRMGHVRFLVFYLVCGLGAHAAHILSSLDSRVPTIGASGAIAGVLGAYALLYPRARVLVLVPLGFFTRLIWVPAVLVLGFWIVIQLVNGLPSLAAPGMGGVAWFAHIGGFAAGMLLIGLFLIGTPRPRRWRWEHDAASRRED